MEDEQKEGNDGRKKGQMEGWKDKKMDGKVKDGKEETDASQG